MRFSDSNRFFITKVMCAVARSQQGLLHGTDTGTIDEEMVWKGPIQRDGVEVVAAASNAALAGATNV